MRLIGSLEGDEKTLAFSRLLHKKGISHQIEREQETDWSTASYGSYRCTIWIKEEDRFKEAMALFESFLEEPDLFLSGEKSATPLFFPTEKESPSKQTQEEKMDNRPTGHITRLLIALCICFFVGNQLIFLSSKSSNRPPPGFLFSSPIDRALLFDFPKAYEQLYRFIKLYGWEDLEKDANLPPEEKRSLEKINATPVWPGYYPLLLRGAGWQNLSQALSVYPTFEKIRQGELWRLFTPCLLHGDILHILFNMLWLVVLGRQMEQRIPPLRYVLFILIVGVLSNTAQYLVSGANFIGFSGVLMGMLAFIWVRQKIAAWEGYRVDRGTFLFVLVFILGLTGIQLLSFVLEKTLMGSFSPNIANTAHLSGGIAGYALGQLEFFRWRNR